MSRDITKLHPALQEKLIELYALCLKQQLKLGIGDCCRSAQEQDALYALGRTKPGMIVTNAAGADYQSQHQWGISFDFFKRSKEHAYDDLSFFHEVGALAKSIGLGWGGDWTDIQDYGHLYLPDWGPSTKELIREYGNPEAFRKTWTAVFPNILRPGMLPAALSVYIRNYLYTAKNRLLSRTK